MQDQHRLSGYAWRVAIATCAIASLAVLWLARDVVCVVFGGVLFAVLLRGLATWLAEHTSMKRGFSLFVVLALLLSMLGGLVAAAVVWGPEQLEAVSKSQAFVELRQFASRFWRSSAPFFQQSAGQAGEISATIIRACTYGLTTFFVSIFLACQPELYRRGALTLVPSGHREFAEHVLDDTGTALRGWLLARSVSMAAVFVLSVPAFLSAGVPLALPLAAFVGLLTFVPYFGPVVSTIPVVLLSMGSGESATLIASGGYVVVQLVTGFVLDPLLQQRIVSLPAALTLSSQVLLGVLVGPLGVAVAAPAVLVVLVVVRRFRQERTPARATAPEPQLPDASDAPGAPEDTEKRDSPARTLGKRTAIMGGAK